MIYYNHDIIGTYICHESFSDITYQELISFMTLTLQRNEVSCVTSAHV